MQMQFFRQVSFLVFGQWNKALLLITDSLQGCRFAQFSLHDINLKNKSK